MNAAIGTPVGRRATYRQGARILAERDPVIADLVAQAGLPKVPPAGESHFATLVRSIVPDAKLSRSRTSRRKRSTALS
jgi:hypothetical protein